MFYAVFTLVIFLYKSIHRSNVQNVLKKVFILGVSQWILWNISAQVRGVFRTQSNIYDGAFFKKILK